MTISKMSATPFKGTISFYNPRVKKEILPGQDTVKFDANSIEAVVDLKDSKKTMIIGKDLVSHHDMRYKIPYAAVSPEEIMAAYTAAKQGDARVNISSSELPICQSEDFI